MQSQQLHQGVWAGERVGSEEGADGGREEKIKKINKGGGKRRR